jgi:HlyD family secretion protein
MRRLLTNGKVLGGVVVVAALFAVALWPETVPVEAGSVSRGALVVTVDEEGQTRVRDRFVVSAPVFGRVLRIELEPGDTVTRGQIVARVRAEAPPLLDARSRAEAQAAVESARATLGRARAEEQRARAALAQARRELGRVRELAAGGLITAQEVDAREAEAAVAEEAANAAAFAVRASSSDLQRAEARLAPPAADTSGRVVTVTSPASGVVLRRVRESESVVPAGDPLLEIGDPRQLEIVSDLLSTDAVRVRAGARAIVDQWGGSRPLDARVRRIEPAGFMKISALGVEEQRVNVILDFVDPAEAWTALGDAYRVEVRIVVWEADAVLKVPTSALFREAGEWAVYVIEGDRARRTIVQVGHQTGQEAEVTSGLAEGTRVILHPGDTLEDGVRIEARAEPSAED